MRRFDRRQRDILGNRTVTAQDKIDGGRHRRRQAIAGIGDDDLLLARLRQRCLDDRNKGGIGHHRQRPAIVRRFKRIEGDIADPRSIKPVIAAADGGTDDGMVKLGNLRQALIKPVTG